MDEDNPVSENDYVGISVAPRFLDKFYKFEVHILEITWVELFYLVSKGELGPGCLGPFSLYKCMEI